MIFHSTYAWLCSFYILVGYDCALQPTSMNGIQHGKGCAGAVWADGSPSKQYCVNDRKYAWWMHCCTWYSGQCVPKILIKRQEKFRENPISINVISFKSISYNSEPLNARFQQAAQESIRSSGILSMSLFLGHTFTV